jgi:hypothetical protein
LRKKKGVNTTEARPIDIIARFSISLEFWNINTKIISNNGIVDNLTVMRKKVEKTMTIQLNSILNVFIEPFFKKRSDTYQILIAEKTSGEGDDTNFK